MNEQTRPNYYNAQQQQVQPINRAGNPLGAAQVQRLLQNQNQADTGVGGSPLGAAPQSVIDNVFTPQAIGKDPYGPVQRGLGLIVRFLLAALIYLVLAIGIVNQAGLSEPWLYILFGIPALITVAYMSNQTDRHTPAGVEIERIAAAERTEFTKGERQERILDKHLANQQELRRMSLEATIKMLERGDRNADQ